MRDAPKVPQLRPDSAAAGSPPDSRGFALADSMLATSRPRLDVFRSHAVRGRSRLPGLSDGERAFHLGGLKLALCAFPMAVDVGRHLQRAVAEMTGEPGDLSAALECAFRKRVAEAVEGPLLAVGPTRGIPARPSPGRARRAAPTARGTRLLVPGKTRVSDRPAGRIRPTTSRAGRRRRRSGRRHAARGSSVCRVCRRCRCGERESPPPEDRRHPNGAREFALSHSRLEGDETEVLIRPASSSAKSRGSSSFSK